MLKLSPSFHLNIIEGEGNSSAVPVKGETALSRTLKDMNLSEYPWSMTGALL